jgi:hypothetical protein
MELWRSWQLSDPLWASGVLVKSSRPADPGREDLGWQVLSGCPLPVHADLHIYNIQYIYTCHGQNFGELLYIPIARIRILGWMIISHIISNDHDTHTHTACYDFPTGGYWTPPFFDGYHHHFWVKFPHDSSRSSLAPGEETRMHVSTDSWVGGDFGFWWEPWWVHNKLWYGAPNFLFLWNKKFMVFVSKKWGVSVGVPGVPFFNVWEALEWFEENMSGNPHILLGGHAPL